MGFRVLGLRVFKFKGLGFGVSGLGGVAGRGWRGLGLRDFGFFRIGYPFKGPYSGTMSM